VNASFYETRARRLALIDREKSGLSAYMQRWQGEMTDAQIDALREQSKSRVERLSRLIAETDARYGYVDSSGAAARVRG
jgi:hypothetical protein